MLDTILLPIASQTKRCSSCEQIKALDQFGDVRLPSGNYGKRAICRTCDVAKARQYRKTDAGRRSRQVEHKRRIDTMLALHRHIKAQQHCLMCPENDPVCLDFHHLDPRGKQYHVAELLRRSFAKYLEEVGKCICICANCHRKLHAGKVALPGGVQPLSRDWLEACAGIARVKIGLPLRIKQQ